MSEPSVAPRSRSFAIPDEKRGDVLEGVDPLIRARWSPRSFTSQPVSDHDLKLILEAARWSASCNNEQPWRFLVARRFDGPLFDRFLSVLVPGNQAWAKTAPVLLFTAAKKTFSNGSPNFHGLHDTGAALASIALQSAALGLQAHGMAGFDREKARRELAIPDDYDPAAAVAIGTVASPDQLEEPYRTRERAFRTRKPLSELAFSGAWEQPLKL